MSNFLSSNHIFGNIVIRTILVIYLLISFSIRVFCQSDIADSTSGRLTFLFVGDILGHDTQINAAYNASEDSYNYDEYFEYLKPVIRDADFTIANLEVTLGGEPYKGYPKFSSPDELAADCRNAGINVLVTANNHCCDRGKKGIIRTINALDLMDISHTGTFKDTSDRILNYPLILEKNGIKVDLLNYTYGTNGIPVPSGVVVNLINKQRIEKDIFDSKKKKVDKIIVFFHWGKEYKSTPDDKQIDLAEFCFSRGVDIVIGSHPHVVQKMEWFKEGDNSGERLIAWSLGNFVSNQRKSKTDGGALIKFTLSKRDNLTQITETGYYLTWVYKTILKNKTCFQILPVSQFEYKPDFFLSKAYFDKMQIFIHESRELFSKQNINVPEYIYDTKDNSWKLTYNLVNPEN